MLSLKIIDIIEISTPKGKIKEELSMIQKIKNLFAKTEVSKTQRLYREWDRQRAYARTPNELSEIDAIFARHI